MILLSAGHFPESPGACHGDFCEHAEAVRWVGLIAAHLRLLQVAYDLVPSLSLIKKVRWINQYHDELPVRLAVEIHFNSDASKRQRGCETLYCPGSLRGLKAAEIVQARMAAVLPPGRGVKQGWYRMDVPGRVDYPGDVDGDEKVDFFLKATKPVAIIIEPEFIYNRTTIEARRDEACEVIAEAIAQVAGAA